MSPITYAPPTPSPGQSTTTSTTHTTAPPTLPTTGSDAATMSFAFGVGIFLVGAVLLSAMVAARRRRQTSG